jgi:RNA polymerase sigma factor (sigma-70 family)
MQNNNDGYYIGKVLAGETAAYSFLVDKYKTMAYNISLRILKRPEDAEEVTQDSFVKAYRALRNFKGKAGFSTWLYRIVYNTSISRLRNKQREMAVENTEIRNDTVLIDDDSSQIDESLTASLKKAVDMLPESEQAMITLYYYDNRSIEDIAKVLSLSPSNVKVRLHRTRKKLYDKVKHSMDNEFSLQ